MTSVTQNMIYFWQGVRKQKPESWFSKNDPMISGSAHWGLSCDPSDFPVHPCSRECLKPQFCHYLTLFRIPKP